MILNNFWGRGVPLVHLFSALVYPCQWEEEMGTEEGRKVFKELNAEQVDQAEGEAGKSKVEEEEQQEKEDREVEDREEEEEEGNISKHRYQYLRKVNTNFFFFFKK